MSEFCLALFHPYALPLFMVYLHPLVRISVSQNLLGLSSDPSTYQGLSKNALESSQSGPNTWIPTNATVSLEVLQITKC